MGEVHRPFFRASFNRAVQVVAGEDRLTSDAGAVVLREADQRLGFVDSLVKRLHDPRDADQVRYQLGELVRQRVFCLAQGYLTQDDADRLAHDPAMRMAVWDRPGERVLEERLASQPTQSRLIGVLAESAHNRQIMRGALGEWVERHLRTRSDHAVRHGTIDIDSFPIEAHGQQAGANYNGHYRQNMYHPLVASFSVGGDYDSSRNGMRLGSGFIHAVLRRGSCHSADGVLRFMEHVIKIGQRLAQRFDMRLDAGFTSGSVMDFLTDRNVKFVGRLKSNPVLDRLAEPHLRRPVGRPPIGGYEDVIELGPYQASTWKHPQRLILVIVDRPDPNSGQLLLEPEYFFLITNYDESQRSGVSLLEHYRQRGTFEDRVGEFNQVVGAKLSSPGFHENEITFLLCLLAFNLVNVLRGELEDSLGGCWDLGRFRDYVLKSGGRVVKHSRRMTLYVAQAVVNFWQILSARIAQWRLAPRFPTPRRPRSRPWKAPPSHAFTREVLRC